MTCRHHLHLNLTRQGHIMNVKLEHTILACVCIHCLLVYFPCRYPYVSTRHSQGDIRGDIRHLARGFSGCCYDYLTRQGGDLCHYLITFFSLPSCSLERCCLILSTLYAMFKPIQP